MELGLVAGRAAGQSWGRNNPADPAFPLRVYPTPTPRCSPPQPRGFSLPKCERRLSDSQDPLRV